MGKTALSREDAEAIVDGFRFVCEPAMTKAILVRPDLITVVAQIEAHYNGLIKAHREEFVDALMKEEGAP